MIDEATKDLEERLAKAKARRAEIERGKSARDAALALANQVEEEERALLDDEAIEAAELEHGPVEKKRIAVVRTDMGAIILKRPNPLIFKRFRDTGSAKTADFEKLVRPSVVYPDAAKLDRILEELPATLTNLADAVVTLAGHRTNEVSEK